MVSRMRGVCIYCKTRKAQCRVGQSSRVHCSPTRASNIFEPVLADINSIVVDVTDLLRRTIGDTVEIRYTLANALWPTVIDTNQIETALLNVATNARDAMPSGGVLLVETANIPTGSDGFPEDAAGHPPETMIATLAQALLPGGCWVSCLPDPRGRGTAV